MAQIGIEVFGQRAVLENMYITVAVLKNKADFKIQKAGKSCLKYAQAACPVGTPESTGKKNYKGGTLKKSLKYQKVAKYECIVTTNVDYSKYVEFGTYKMKAQPFLYPSYYRALGELYIDLNEGI